MNNTEPLFDPMTGEILEAGIRAFRSLAISRSSDPVVLTARKALAHAIANNPKIMARLTTAELRAVGWEVRPKRRSPFFNET